MATIPGTEFQNWQNLPSLTDEFHKQASGAGFNPILAAVGYGLDKLNGNSDNQDQPVAPPLNYQSQSIGQPTNQQNAIPGASNPVSAMQNTLPNLANTFQSNHPVLSKWSDYAFGAK